MDALRRSLVAAQIPSQFDSMQLYIPIGAQNEILSAYSAQRDTLHALGLGNLDRNALEATDPFWINFDIHTLNDSTTAIRELILKRGRRLFLILVYTRLTRKVLYFWKHGFADKSLPLEYDFQTDTIIDASDSTSKVFDTWDTVEIREFCDAQWRFTALRLTELQYNWQVRQQNLPVPSFSLKGEHRGKLNKTPQSSLRTTVRQKLPVRTVLPFEVLKHPEGTASSKVFKIKVHQDHRARKGILALKETADQVIDVFGQLDAADQVELKTAEVILKSSQASFKESLGALHLVHLRAAFQRGHFSYMMFDWASGENLYRFWRVQDASDWWSFQWIQDQMIGLIAGLRFLHDLGIRHGDLKPPNILVYGKTSTLKITDFGIARVHDESTAARVQRAQKHTEAKPGAKRYMPPEIDRARADVAGPSSRRYDIWSLGCILLEFVIWLRSGAKEWKSFNDELGHRKLESFWTLDSNGHCVLQPRVLTGIADSKAKLNDDIQRLSRSSQVAMQAPSANVVMGNDDEDWPELGTPKPEKPTKKAILIESDGKAKKESEGNLVRFLLYVLDKVEKRMLVIKTTNNDDVGNGHDNNEDSNDEDEENANDDEADNADEGKDKTEIRATSDALWDEFESDRMLGGLFELIENAVTRYRDEELSTVAADSSDSGNNDELDYMEDVERQFHLGRL